MNTDVCAHEGDGVSHALAEFSRVSVSTQERGRVSWFWYMPLQRVDERSIGACDLCSS